MYKVDTFNGIASNKIYIRHHFCIFSFLDEIGLIGPKQFLSWVRESSIFSAVKSSLDALGEKDLIDVMNQVNHRRISDKEVLQL